MPQLDAARLQRLIDVARSLVARHDPEAVLRNVLHAARELTGARYAALGILDRDKRELERFLTLGVDEETEAAIGELPRGRGVLGELITHPEPLRLRDVGSHPRSFGFPPNHPPMHSFLGVPVAIRGEAWGNLYLAEKDGGGEFDATDEQAVVTLADIAAVAIENSRLYSSLARERDEAERQRDRLEQSLRALEVMTEIAGAVAGEIRLERVLELIVKRGRALVQARALLILLAEGDELVVAATAGELEQTLEGARIPVADTIPGQVLRSQRPERLSSLEGLGSTLSDLGISCRAAMLVPLTFRQDVSGVLAALDRTLGGPEFNAEDERLLRSFAVSAGTAVGTAKSVEEKRLRDSIEASEQERRRWARELHDETLQALGGLQMLCAAALRSDDPGALRAAMTEGRQLLDTEIDNLSALIAELRPAALDEIGLEPALRTLARRKGRAGGLQVEVSADIGERLPPELESTVYRVAQEALNNVVKHADARNATVAVTRREDVVEVLVEDDGRGFDPDAPPTGFGLPGMRERIALAGGQLSVKAAVGRGTAISARLPIGLPDEAGAPGLTRPARG